MSETDQQIEWYLARDGKQHGPISDLEMRKLVELGHLRPTDLVWRQGFADWIPASNAFPATAPQPVAPPPPSMPRPAAEARQRPVTNPQGGGRDQRASGPAPHGSGLQQHGAFQPNPYQQPQPKSQPTPQQGRPADPRRGSIQSPEQSRQRSYQPGSDAAESDEAEPKHRGRFPWKTVAAVLLLAVMSGAGLALHKTGRLNFQSLAFLATDEKDSLPVVRAPKDALKESPLKSFEGNVEGVDASFQKAPLWRLMKKEFPEWYGERLNDAVRLKGEQKDDKEIAVYLTQALVDLRRKNSSAALSASPARLKFIASAFVENLDRLSKQSIDACYGFISQGEISPPVVDLLRSSEHTAALQGQFMAIFEAVIEGRKAPSTHTAPQREDYDVLAAQLSLRGWSPADLQLFSDARALSRAQPERVCKMVHDWFSAQLSVKDEAVQMRLLVEALKPVVAG